MPSQQATHVRVAISGHRVIISFSRSKLPTTLTLEKLTRTNRTRAASFVGSCAAVHTSAPLTSCYLTVAGHHGEHTSAARHLGADTPLQRAGGQRGRAARFRRGLRRAERGRLEVAASSEQGEPSPAARHLQQLVV